MYDIDFCVADDYYLIYSNAGMEHFGVVGDEFYHYVRNFDVRVTEIIGLGLFSDKAVGVIRDSVRTIEQIIGERIIIRHSFTVAGRGEARNRFDYAA